MLGVLAAIAVSKLYPNCGPSKISGFAVRNWKVSIPGSIDSDVFDVSKKPAVFDEKKVENSNPLSSQHFGHLLPSILAPG